jgi:adenylate cyclase
MPMSAKDSKHKLTAIFYADVVDYSRLTGQDEIGTHKSVMDVLDFASETIKSDSGVVLRYAGDAILAEFPSVVAAVKSAVFIQVELQKRNQEEPDDNKIEIRIGVNLGEVLEDRGEIFGDGVNTTARLESIASPGGIAISGLVYKLIRGKVEIEFEDCGEEFLKNISEPVHVFRWQSGSPPKKAEKSSNSKPSRKIPSIAVLPFVNMSGDPEQEYLADGICEDIITALSKIRVFTVIARTSTFSYKGQSVDVKQVAKDLEVNYVLEGSLRRAGDRVRITAQLIDHDGLHVWAEKYDRVIEDIFELQDEMTQTIAGALEPELHAVERERAARKPPESLDAWECYQRGLWNMWRFENESMIAAWDLFQKAVDLDPGFATAYAYQSYCNYISVVLGFSVGRDRLVEEGKLLAKKAVEIDPRDPIAYFSMGRNLMMLGDHDGAIAALKYSLELNPNFAHSYFGLGFVLALSGELDEARENIRTAIRLSPRDPLMAGFTNILGMVCIMAGDFEEGLDWAKRSLRLPTPMGYWNHATLTSAYANLGQMEEATEALKGAVNEKPDLSISFLEKVLPTRHKDGLGVYFSGLLLAGLPE